MVMLKYLAAILITAAALGTIAKPTGCETDSITDGDTIKVSCEGRVVTVRLGGIDAPEKKMRYGKAAKQALVDLCGAQPVMLRARSKDRYGRTVADVECRGLDASTEQVRAGMAWVYDKYAKGYEHLYPLQDAARAAKVGLWADPAPVKPWKWRKVTK